MSTRDTIKQQPVMSAAALQAAIVAGINLIAAFGLVTVTADQMAAINGFLAITMPLVFGMIVKGRVTTTDTAPPPAVD